MGTGSGTLDGFVLIPGDLSDVAGAPVPVEVAEPAALHAMPEGDCWERVRFSVRHAEAMHFDGCHKIFISMDGEQARRSANVGYVGYAPDYARLREWFDYSCPFRLVTAVSTSRVDGSDVLETLVPRGSGDVASRRL